MHAICQFTSVQMVRDLISIMQSDKTNSSKWAKHIIAEQI